MGNVSRARPVTTEQRMTRKELESFMRRWLAGKGARVVVEVRIQDDRGGNGDFVVIKTYE